MIWWLFTKHAEVRYTCTCMKNEVVFLFLQSSLLAAEPAKQYHNVSSRSGVSLLSSQTFLAQPQSKLPRIEPKPEIIAPPGGDTVVYTIHSNKTKVG